MGMQQRFGISSVRVTRNQQTMVSLAGGGVRRHDLRVQIVRQGNNGEEKG